jgi:hypothetical protein
MRMRSGWLAVPPALSPQMSAPSTSAEGALAGSIDAQNGLNDVVIQLNHLVTSRHVVCELVVDERGVVM